MPNTTDNAAAPTHALNFSGREWLNEFWGGLAAMLVALPSSIAFGVLVYSAISPDMAGQGALVGMIGAAALGLVAPFAGGTPALISAPCAPAAAVLTGLAYELTAAGVASERVPVLLAMTALVAALLQVLYGLVRGGQLIKYIPYPVVSGYLSGVGLIIALSQLPKLLGLPDGTGLLHGLSSPALWQWPGLAVGLVTISVMLAAPAVVRKIPSAIAGLFAGIVVYFIIGLFVPSLLTVEGNPLLIGPMHSTESFAGTISGQIGALGSVRLKDFELVIYAAIALSALLSIDTLKTCVVLGALTRKRSNSNRELFGQGIANLASFTTGGMPGAGTMGPTLVNFTSGGRDVRSGVIEGILVVLVILALAPLIAWVPIAALSGVLLIVAFRMFDWEAFRLLQYPDTRLDFFVIAAVVMVAETIGLIAASAIGVGLAILLFIRDQIRGSVLRRRASLSDISSKTHRLETERSILKERGDNAAIYELQGNLFFGTTDQLFTELERDLRSKKWLLFDMRRVHSMDYTAAHLFAQMQEQLEERGGGILFSGMPSRLPNRQDLQRYMVRVGLIGEGGAIRILETRDEALEWMENRILEEEGWNRDPEHGVLELEEIELTQGLDSATLEELRSCMYERAVHSGEKVFAYGEAGDNLYLIRRGVVRILLPLQAGKYHHVATFARGDFFGEMAFLDRDVRSADAVAKTDCELYVLSRQEFNTRMESKSGIEAQLFERIARAISLRLRQTNSELRTIEDR